MHGQTAVDANNIPACAVSAAILLFSLAQGAWADFNFQVPLATSPAPTNIPSTPAHKMAELRKLIAAADTALEHRDWKRARRAIDNALLLAPGSPAVLSRAATFNTIRRRFFIAEDYWSRLCHIDPYNPGYSACLGGVMLRLHTPITATNTLAHALELDPLNLIARFNLGLYSIAHGDYVRAGRLLDARDSSELGKLAQWSADEMSSAAALIPSNRYARLATCVLSGNCAPDGSAGKVKENTAVIITRLRKVAYDLWQSVTAGKANNWSSARKNLAQAFAAGATSPAILQDINVCDFMRGKKTDAINGLRRLVQTYPGREQLREKFAELLLAAGNYNQAVIQFRKSIIQNPQDYAAGLGLACVSAIRGEKARARIIVSNLAPAYHRLLAIPGKLPYAAVFKDYHGLLDLLRGKRAAGRAE